jgi:outer membrane protein assembly factor BamB
MHPAWTWALSPLLALGAAAAAPAADEFKPKAYDWPQWLGPDRTGISKETGLLKDWPKDGPPLVWTAKGLGGNFSTPSVAAGRIFGMSFRDKDEVVWALNEADGKELWVTRVAASKRYDHGEGPRCTPTVDGELLYALGASGDLACMEAASGKIRWQKNLTDKEYGGSVPHWAYSESPLVDGDKLLVTPGGKKATLLCLDKRTGETIWKGVTPQGEGAHYSSIIAVTMDGKRQYIQFTSQAVVGFSGDGQFLWRYDHPHNGTANCSSPIFADNCVFAASSYGTGGGLAKLTAAGDGKVKAEEVYFTKKMKNHHGGMVLIDGYLYGSDEGQLTCLEFKTGDVKWQEGKAGKGSITAADGRLYYRNEGGPLILVEVNPDKYVEHGRIKQPERSKSPAWAHPVVANGKLYVIDQDVMLCFDVKAK